MTNKIAAQRTTSLEGNRRFEANVEIRRAAGSSRRRQRVPKPRRQRTPRRRCVTLHAAFLAAYRKSASITAAAKSAGIRPALHYRWLATSAAYWERFTEVQQDVTGRLQDAVVQLATEGQVVPVLYRGRVCGTFQRPSPRLLLSIWRR